MSGGAGWAELLSPPPSSSDSWATGKTAHGGGQLTASGGDRGKI